MKKILKVCKKYLQYIMLPFVNECVDISDQSAQLALIALNEIHKDVQTSAISNNFSCVCNPTYDLDIIIPVYKVEKYIQRCIDSLLSQKTKFLFRLICIDDGSPDNSGKILEELYSVVPNILIVHQKNKGVASARNTALSLVDSKYIMFVDSDDYLPCDNVIDQLLTIGFHNDYDIVGGGYDSVSETGSINMYVPPHVEGLTDKDGHFGFPWGKIIKSKIFGNIVFPEGYWFEDSVMRQIVYEKSVSAFYINKAVYAYRSNPESQTYSAIGNPKAIDSLYVTIGLYRDRCSLDIKTDKKYVDYLVRMARLTNHRTRKLNKEIRKNIFIVYANWFKKNFASYIIKDKMFQFIIEGNYGKYSIL